MTARRRFTIMLGCLLLAGCGNKVDLRPQAGAAPRVAPLGSSQPETPAQLTTPDSAARPGRSDEPLKRSQERATDEFDLPPPG